MVAAQYTSRDRSTPLTIDVRDCPLGTAHLKLHASDRSSYLQSSLYLGQELSHDREKNIQSSAYHALSQDGEGEEVDGVAPALKQTAPDGDCYTTTQVENPLQNAPPLDSVPSKSTIVLTLLCQQRSNAVARRSHEDLPPATDYTTMQIKIKIKNLINKINSNLMVPELATHLNVRAHELTMICILPSRQSTNCTLDSLLAPMMQHVTAKKNLNTHRTFTGYRELRSLCSM